MRFYDPTGARYGLPTYPFRLAPDGLATTRQLRARGLRPGGQEPVAQVLWRSRRYLTARDGSPVRAAYLYRVDRALPVRPMTPAKWAALAKANAARRVCPSCRRDRGYTIPTSLGTCLICADVPAALAA
ncbi:RRQRL motif-containing zinc-binding protein [Streptomyces cacaoi]|uniref:RRQRL motif-containing zinc-binding protein n=1 Tax=Streptomyces cacaoi TaxID=1898 RepID=UPI0033173ABC